MRPFELTPPDELRTVIKCFWHIVLDFGAQPASREILPDGYAEIIFYFGGSCSVATAGGWQPLPSPFLMGLLNRPVRLQAQGQLQVLGVRCFPWTVFELLGLPPGQGGVHVFEHPIARLQAPLAECVHTGRPTDALAQLAQYFGQAHLPPAAGPLLGKAGEAMRAAGGTLPVSQVAAAAHATVRTLERKFKQAVGYTVKDVSGLLRFEQARNQLWLNPAASLAGLAHELGYTDQAHLSREFKRYSGTTPAAFARQARREPPAADFVAFVQA